MQARQVNEANTQRCDALDETLQDVLRQCALPDKLTVMHSHVLRQLLLNMADQIEVAAVKSMELAVQEELHRQEVAATLAAGPDPTESASTPVPAPKVKGSGRIFRFS